MVASAGGFNPRGGGPGALFVPFALPLTLLASSYVQIFFSISNLLLSLLSQTALARVPLLLNERLAAVILDCVADFVFAGKSFAFVWRASFLK